MRNKNKANSSNGSASQANAPSSSTAGSGKKPRRKLDIWNKFAVFILTLFLVGCVSVFFVLVNIVNDPDGMRFSKDGLSTLSNSRIFDDSGNMIYEFGAEIRDDITYDQIPQNLIDAFLAIEDSRYFTHNGFDLPRFMAAGLTNLKSGGFSQGGSTLTMQMIDNAFTKNQEDKLLEENGSISKLEKIKLKIQEIYLALIAEQTIDKEDIIEYYLNRIWFGSGRNTRGIQKAAKYYFNKDVTQLNLGEAAFLAGSINAPYTNNPLNNIHSVGDSTDTIDHLAAGQQRRNTTLELMLKHGYITEEEYNLEKSVDLAFALDWRETITIDPNQAYIDQVISEAAKLSGQDPAIIPMDIYTALNQSAQAELDKIMTGTVIPFPNEMIDFGTTIINNTTGEIIAVGAGRHYHSDSVKQDNSLNTRQPGSAMKPLLSYCSTFDILGWATNHIVIDQPKDYWGGGANLRNADGKYDGAMTLSRALGVSKNTPAAQAMIDLISVTGTDYWIKFCKDLGFDDQVAELFVPQYAIGGADMFASPTQMASAYTIFANQGRRVNAHRIRRIIRRSDNSEINGNTTTYELISTQAAYMMSTLLRDVVYGGYQNYNEVLANPNYTAYGKSGTSSWEEEAIQYGIPAGVMKDEWSVAYTSTYSIATWSGYLPVYFMQGYYMGWTELEAAPAFHINRYMLDFLSATGDYHPIDRPDGIADYNGGLIKAEFASRGDVSSAYQAGTSFPTDELSAARSACLGSGGSFDNGACSCPNGMELNGFACQAKTTPSVVEETPSTTDPTPTTPTPTPVTPDTTVPSTDPTVTPTTPDATTPTTPGVDVTPGVTDQPTPTPTVPEEDPSQASQQVPSVTTTQPGVPSPPPITPPEETTPSVTPNAADQPAPAAVENQTSGTPSVNTTPEVPANPTAKASEDTVLSRLSQRFKSLIGGAWGLETPIVVDLKKQYDWDEVSLALIKS